MYTKEQMKGFADWCRNGLTNIEYGLEKLDQHLEDWENLNELTKMPQEEPLKNEKFKNNLIRLGFIHLGAEWYHNKKTDIKIRLWKNYEIDFWKFNNLEDGQIHFRGKIKHIEEVNWVLKRCF